MSIPCLGYAAPRLDDPEGENSTGVKKSVGKKLDVGPPAKTARQKVVRSKDKCDSGIEDGDNSSPDVSDTNEPFNRARETSGDEPSSGSSEDGSPSHSDLDSASAVKKAPSIRKPSKKAIQKALNEVSDT